ncbi:uncharacterized protein L969DRAFT_48627 [Mixia osmundae IAM 14324]|uniref:CCDC43 PWI-like domain-containing protein n=1 Tax=Mixia osmundae (strain CBS 9802 / IAM 14324 / JCM 22182 / KY 12970) TaxID=764103 RepID=G7E3E8_MIXOS|nr:uncharacterized protein L969DRAFT_48627 [Mixia osmundae IAM 14324]KEI39344.1 hypothetical protein L969DRAFT_48627 [Mixia osmundae IAM 14324]GAA97358.1 hypothetical protein E5Q_04036 [Mixia osmundae IAM 14324]
MTWEEDVASALGKLGLHDEVQVQYVAGILQDEAIDEEDKRDAMTGVLAEVEEDEATLRPTLDHLISLSERHLARSKDLEAIKREQDLLAARERTKQATARVVDDEPASKPAGRELTEEQRADRARILASYALIADDESDPEESAAASAPPEATADVSTLSKKQRKRLKDTEDGIDLLARPNMNVASVRAAEEKKRAAAKDAAVSKSIKDKADLLKQRTDQAKRKEEAQKKAARGERRA